MSKMIGIDSGEHIYDLFAVSNHFGGLGGGHCIPLFNVDTAYTFNTIDQRWYNCDDSHVSEVNGNVVTKAAYLLLYRKRDTNNVDLKIVVDAANEKRRFDLEAQRTSLEIAPTISASPVDVRLGSSSPLETDLPAKIAGPQEIPSDTGTTLNSPTISEVTPVLADEFDPATDHYILEFP